MPVNPNELDKALAAIRKVYGDSAVRAGGEREPLARIPTGSTQLDWATGGGIPLGRWAHFYGGYSSAKTLTCWNIIREAQQLGLTCAYYNIEKQYDAEWVAGTGVDIDALNIIEGTTIEGVGTMLETLLSSCHVHVVDSLAAAVSKDELAGKLEDWMPGLQARAWGKVLRRANERFDDKDNLIILVNQVRDTFGGRGGESPTSGRFVEYMSSLSLYFRRSSWLYQDKHGNLTPDGSNTQTITGDTEPAGIEFQARVNKSRVGPPLRTARMRLNFDDGAFDEVWPLVKGATYFNVVQRNGAWYTLPDGETKVQGENGLRAAILESPELQETIRATIKANA